jgi:hypothetical protein
VRLLAAATAHVTESGPYNEFRSAVLAYFRRLSASLGGHFVSVILNHRPPVFLLNFFSSLLHRLHSLGCFYIRISSSKENELAKVPEIIGFRCPRSRTKKVAPRKELPYGRTIWRVRKDENQPRGLV